MKILWVKSDFLHPTERGGQIRTLEMLRQLHRWHEVHYIAFDVAQSADSVRRAAEYCTRAYPIERRVPPRSSPAFWGQFARNLFSDLPLTLARYQDAGFRQAIRDVIGKESPDLLVCDFLMPAVNIEDLGPWVLFQHNVETMIWRRTAEHAPDVLRKAYFGRQAARMFNAESRIVKSVRRVIAVSESDAQAHRELFGMRDVPWVSTGVDIESLTPPGPQNVDTDLVFVGSMDWLPNIDGVNYFLDEILPLIRAKRPATTVKIIGRRPPAALLRRAEDDPKLAVTGTVADIRPHLWGGAVSIVPLRIGGGTRLKIYESMSARVPVVSTTIGAEGLDIHPLADIVIADAAQPFADACLDLLNDPVLRRQIAAAAWEMVAVKYSWKRVARDFERLLTERTG